MRRLWRGPLLQMVSNPFLLGMIGLGSCLCCMFLCLYIHISCMFVRTWMHVFQISPGLHQISVGVVSTN